MFYQDRSVPQAVKEVITSNEFYLKAIKSGIVNYTALANKIQPEVEDITGSNINIGTIVVAIKRFADNLNKDKEHSTSEQIFIDQKINEVQPRDARMTLTDSIVDIDIKNHNISKNIFNLIDELTNDILFDYNLVQTHDKIKIFTEDIFESRKIISKLIEIYQGKITEGLSKITVTISYENSDKIRILLFNIFEILNNYKIILNNIFFTNKEIILILDSNNAAKAYDLLRKKILK